MFRPTTLDELTGCEDEKKIIRVSCEASVQKNEAFPHLLIYGPSGLGKTTIASLVARERGGPFKEYLSNVFCTKKDIQNLLAELNFDGYDDDGNIIGEIHPTTIFLDEVHQLSKKIQESLFQAMEDFKFTTEEFNPLNGKKEKTSLWCPKFTLIGATTKPGLLDKAFLDRFKIIFNLKTYTQDEIVEILSVYAGAKGIGIDLEAAHSIAEKSRGVARKSINFIERCFDTSIYLKSAKITKKVVEETFKLLSIDDQGLEDIDLQILKYLYEIYPNRIGIGRLAAVTNVTDTLLSEIIEPYLMRINFIHVTPSGRIISEKGMQYLEKNNLNKEDKIIKTTTLKRVTNV